jgi:predicted PurR-regulated permease PerM
MRTTALITLILFAGWTLPGQEIREMSENLGKMQKEVQRLKGTDQSLRVQVKQLKSDLGTQQQLLTGISVKYELLRQNSDSLNALLENMRKEMQKTDEKLAGSVNRLMAITLAGLFLVVLLLIIFIIQHRKMHEERSKRLEILGADLRRETAEELKKVDDKLLQRIELLEEKVY